ncbi:MAG: hypothetical protein EOP89_15205, partial [Lysobacteraceae bacterium]
RHSTLLNDNWASIIDPFDSGTGWRAVYKDITPSGKTDFVEYSFESDNTLNVPGDFNSQLPELTYFESTVWYKRTFDADVSASERLFIHFGAVNYIADVYFNGKKIGSHEGGFTPFQFEVTDLMKAKGNALLVRVNSARQRNGIPANGFETVTFAVATNGDAIGEVTITINGANDPAEPAGDTGPNMFESGIDADDILHTDEQDTVSGQLIANDPDDGESLWEAATIRGDYGSLTIDANGNYVYTLDQDNAFIDALEIGELANDTIVVRTVDGTEQEISVAINGADDVATFTGTAAQVDADDVDVEGTVITTDPDSDTAPLTATSTLIGEYGTLVLNGNGTYVYTVNQAAAGPLSGDENPTDTFDFTTPDGSQGQIVITVNG